MYCPYSPSRYSCMYGISGASGMYCQRKTISASRPMMIANEADIMYLIAAGRDS